MNLVEWLQHLMTNFGAAWVMYLMLGLSVISVTIMLERGWFYFSIRDDIPSLAQTLRDRLRDDDLGAALGLLEKSPSAEAAVVVAGLREADRGVSAADKAMRGAAALQKMKLERRLAFLGTLGNNAPFIGLFGTVWGIMNAFLRIGQEKSASLPVVAPAIGEALIATAIGLVAAIPATIAFNYVDKRIADLMEEVAASSEVWVQMLMTDAGESAGVAPRAAGTAGVTGSPGLR